MRVGDGGVKAAARGVSMAHLKTFAVAAAFGLGAYGVVQGLVFVSRKTGLLAWLAS